MTAAPIPSVTIGADDLIGLDVLSLRARLLRQAGMHDECAEAEAAIEQMRAWRADRLLVLR